MNNIIQTVTERINVWLNVYRRIRYFRSMYPLSSIAKDIVLFPIDYYFKRRPITSVRNLTFAITHQCNLRCEMCYFIEEIGNKNEISLEVYRKVIDSAKKSKPCVILSGGEPFAHRDILKMVDYAKSQGLPVQIFTNGILVKPEMADALIGMNLDYINFTLLGNEKSHSKVAQVPTAYTKFRANLEYISKIRGNTKIIINFTVTPTAIDDIYHLIELAKLYRPDGLRIQHYNYLLPEEFKAHAECMTRLFHDDSPIHEIEDAADHSIIAEKLKKFERIASRDVPDIPIQWTPTLTHDEMDNWYSGKKFQTKRGCMFPWRGILIDAEAKIYPCSKIYLEYGDAKVDELFDVWNGERSNRFRDKIKDGLLPACSRCCKL